jgi:hypothetical protein
VSSTTRRSIGVSMSVLALVMGALSFVAAPEEPAAVVVQQWVFVLVTVGVGLLLVLKRPAHRIGFVMLGVGFSFSMMGTGQAMTRVAFEAGSITVATIWAQFEGVGWVFFILTLFNLLPLWFPTGQTANRLGRWLIRIAGVVTVVAVLGTVLASQTCVSWPAGGFGDDCLQFASSSWGFLDYSIGEVAGQAVLLLTGLVSLISLGYRFVRATGTERHQLKWFALGFALFGVTLTVSLILETNMDLVIWTAVGVVPASIALAVLRYRLYDIDRIVSRTVSYALVVILIGGSFLALAALVGSRVSEKPLFVAAATLAAAAMFNPIRSRVQTLVDGRFNRSKYVAQRVMDEFAGSLRDRVDADQVVEGWLGVVEDTMQPSAVGVWMRS